MALDDEAAARKLYAELVALSVPDSTRAGLKEASTSIKPGTN